MKKSYNNDTFCVAPWLASHISTWDDVTPCCLFKTISTILEKEGKSDMMENELIIILNISMVILVLVNSKV